MKNPILIMVIVALLAGGIGFYGGMTYQKSQRGSFRSANGQNVPLGSGARNGNGRQGGMMQGVRPVSGEITNIDGNTMTIKQPDGSSKIIVFSDSTKIAKNTDGTKDDLKVGERITAIGSIGSDGTVSATNVSVGGSFFFGGPSTPVASPAK